MDTNEYMTTREAVIIWYKTETLMKRVAALCHNNKIDGAIKEGNRWYIPRSSKRPQLKGMR